MVDLVTGLRLLGGTILLLANGFFVGIEFAMTRVRQFDESEFQGSRGLERAWEMTERLEIYLSGCQVGITISSVGLGVVAEPALAAIVHLPLVELGLVAPGAHTVLSVGIALAIINLLHVIIGEQAPTYFGVERTKTAAHYGAPLLYWWTYVMSPVIRVADWIAKWILRRFGVEMTRSWAEEELEEGASSRAELRSQMGEILAEGGLPKERREEVLNALRIGDKPVRDIMVDRDQVVALPVEADVDENLQRMRENPHVRFPLVRGEFEEYLGVVYSPAVLQHLPELESGEVTLADVASEPMTLDADTPVSEVIDRFQEAGEELALVVEDGEPVGLVTPTDAWEEITGELRDPLDDETAAG